MGRRTYESMCTRLCYNLGVLAALSSVATVFLFAPSADGQNTAVSKSSGPPGFFLQDPVDGLCLTGGNFKRCGIDTLWFATGKPGSYQIHKRTVEETDDDVCLDRAHCHLDESELVTGSCNHCGAKKWNILGDAETGYVLTEDANKNCIKRGVGSTSASMIKCDLGYTALQLQFATKDVITAMSSEGARLVSAALDNDLSTVKKFLEEKVDVNSRDWDNLTPLIAASGKGYLEMVKLLVSSYSADVNLFDKDNITALMEATIGGHKAVVAFLAGAGADVDSPAASGVSSLWMAAGEGQVDILSFLISQGADPNNKRADGITALMAASAGGKTESVKALLAAGASVHGADKEGMTALISACENGTIAVVEALLQHKAEVNVLSENGFSPLIIASAHGHTDVARLLLENGAEIDMEHKESVSALMYAAAGGFPETVNMLIEKGADVNRRHKQGGSAIMEAATSGNMTVFQALLSAKADPFIIDDDGVNTLMSAAAQGHTELCRLLLEKGLKVNDVAKSGGTAVMFAAGAGHNETTRLLIDSGADVNVVVQATPEYIETVAKAIADGKEDVEPHKDGVTALIVAAQGGHIGPVMMLVEAGAVVDVTDDEDFTPLLSAVKGNFGKVALYLLEHGANPNDSYTDDKGKKHNLLMDAITVKNEEFALLLIAKGANVSYASEADSVTVATQAAYLGLAEVVSALVSKGADINAANKEGINPLIAAASEGFTEIVRTVLSRSGIDINAKDKDGTNALMAAAVRGHLPVVNLLLENKAGVNAQNVDGHSALMFAYNGKNQVQSLMDKYKDYLKEDSEKNENSTRIMKEALQTHVDVVNALLKHGADPGLKDNEGHVALDFDYKPPEKVEKLLEDKPSPTEGSITPDREL